MSFSFVEVLRSILSAIVFGVGFAALWMIPSALFNSGFMAAVGVVLFSLGFMLLSYYSLDGMLRLYMLVIAFSAFILTKKYIFDKIIVFLKKMAKKVANIPLFGRLKRLHTLDKAKEK